MHATWVFLSARMGRVAKSCTIHPVPVGGKIENGGFIFTVRNPQRQVTQSQFSSFAGQSSGSRGAGRSDQGRNAIGTETLRLPQRPNLGLGEPFARLPNHPSVGAGAPSRSNLRAGDISLWPSRGSKQGDGGPSGINSNTAKAPVGLRRRPSMNANELYIELLSAVSQCRTHAPSDAGPCTGQGGLGPIPPVSPPAQAARSSAQRSPVAPVPITAPIGGGSPQRSSRDGAPGSTRRTNAGSPVRPAARAGSPQEVISLLSEDSAEGNSRDATRGSP